VNEVSHVYLADVNWDLGQSGTLHVHLGKGPRIRAAGAAGAADQLCRATLRASATASRTPISSRQGGAEELDLCQNLPLLVFPVVVGGQSLMRIVPGCCRPASLESARHRRCRFSLDLIAAMS
jgi:hypothetical protein